MDQRVHGSAVIDRSQSFGSLSAHGALVILQGPYQGDPAGRQEFYAWLGKAQTQQAMKSYNDSLISYSKVLALNNTRGDLWVKEGIVQGSMKLYNDSMKSFDEAIAIDSKNANIWVEKGDEQRSLRLYNDSVVSYRKAASINRNSTGAWLGFASAYEAQKNYKSAFAAISNATIASPKSASYRYISGYYLLALG